MASAPDAELHKGLKQRHLTMIAIGGVIGAGLFVGSGAVINEVGPGAFLCLCFAAMLSASFSFSYFNSRGDSRCVLSSSG